MNRILHPEFFLRHREDAMNLFRAAMWHMHPSNRIPDIVASDGNKLIVNGSTYDIGVNKLWVVGAGKAAHTMAEAVETAIGSYIHDGLIVTPPGVHYRSSRIRSLHGNHPVPSGESLIASLELDKVVRRIPQDALVLALISGGTSSLVALPPEGLTIDDISQTGNLLLRSGAGISEINTVRRHICKLKGGNLPRQLKSQNLVSLIYSDVPGDRLHDIGSGLTVPDPTTFADALDVMDEYGLRTQIPEAVLRYLMEGADGQHSENPKTTNDLGVDHQVVMVGSSTQLANHVSKQATARGADVTVFNPAYHSTARSMAREIASRVRDKVRELRTRQVLVFHGESKVHVTGSGRGGRNQELALLVLLALEEISVPWTLMSIGTDGIDGNTDVAGAFVYNGLLPLARHQGYSPEGYLLDNDAYHFFLGVDTLIRTGPTGNNMTDLQILILDP